MSAKPPIPAPRSTREPAKVPQLNIARCWAPNDGEERDEDYCALYEASECGSPCSTCYFAPCEHGNDFGCGVTCAVCGHPCCRHNGINPATGEVSRVCLDDDDQPCNLGCTGFRSPRP